MINDNLRKAINKYGEENDLEILMFESPSFDNSIVGIDVGGRLIYDFDKMIEEYMQDNDCDYDDALEFIEYNTIRSLSYYSNSPLVQYKVDFISERYGD